MHGKRYYLSTIIHIAYSSILQSKNKTHYALHVVASSIHPDIQKSNSERQVALRIIKNIAYILLPTSLHLNLSIYPSFAFWIALAGSFFPLCFVRLGFLSVGVHALVHRNPALV